MLWNKGWHFLAEQVAKIPDSLTTVTGQIIILKDFETTL